MRPIMIGVLFACGCYEPRTVTLPPPKVAEKVAEKADPAAGVRQAGLEFAKRAIEDKLSLNADYPWGDVTHQAMPAVKDGAEVYDRWLVSGIANVGTKRKAWTVIVLVRNDKMFGPKVTVDGEAIVDLEAYRKMAQGDTSSKSQS